MSDCLCVCSRLSQKRLAFDQLPLTFNKINKSDSRCIPHTAWQAEGTQCYDNPFPNFRRTRFFVISRNSTPRFASTPERRIENINLNKYFILSSVDRTHSQSILQSHFAPLRHDWPNIIQAILYQARFKHITIK